MRESERDDGDSDLLVARDIFRMESFVVLFFASFLLFQSENV